MECLWHQGEQSQGDSATEKLNKMNEYLEKPMNVPLGDNQEL